MTQSLAHDLDRHPGLEEQRGVHVAKVMKPDERESRLADEPLEGIRENLGMDELRSFLLTMRPRSISRVARTRNIP